MAQADRLNELTIPQLKELAAQNDVELEGKTKDDIVDEMVATNKVTNAKIDAFVEAQNPPEEETPTAEPATEAPPLEADFVEPPTGDVNVADLPKEHYNGEIGPIIHEGMWVQLRTLKDVVGEDYNGAIAAVLDSPWKSAPIGADQDLHGYVFDERTDLRVRIRDATDAIIAIPSDQIEGAVQSHAQTRAELTNVG